MSDLPYVECVCGKNFATDTTNVVPMHTTKRLMLRGKLIPEEDLCLASGTILLDEAKP